MDRKQHWEQLYAHKSPLEVSWYQADPETSLKLIRASGVGQEGSIIDVGGGASVLVDRLAQAAFARWRYSISRGLRSRTPGSGLDRWPLKSSGLKPM